MMAIVAWYESFDHLESLLSKLHTPQKVEISGKSPFSSIFIIAGIRRVKARCAKWAGVEWFNVQCCFVSAEFSGAEFFLGCGCHVGCVCSLFSRVWHLIHELRSLEGKQLGKLWWRCWGKGPRFKLRWCSRSVTKLRSPLLNLLQSSNKSVCLDERRRDVERQCIQDALHSNLHVRFDWIEAPCEFERIWSTKKMKLGSRFLLPGSERTRREIELELLPSTLWFQI